MRKLLGKLFAIVVLASLSMAVMASDAAAETQACDECGVGRLFSHKEYGAWRLEVYQFVCSHRYPEGHDEDQTREVDTVWACDSCTFSKKSITHEESRTLCYGADFFTERDRIDT